MSLAGYCAYEAQRWPSDVIQTTDDTRRASFQRRINPP
jgi:hypothetical protein